MARIVWWRAIGQFFRDGHSVPGLVSGAGSTESPILYLADLENPSQLHFIVQP